MKRIATAFIIMAFSLFYPWRGQCQDETSEDPLRIIGLRFHRSFVIQHTPKLKDEVTRSNPWCVEADINWHLRKRDTWNYCYCYPRTGFTLRYTNFDFPEVLGHAISVYPFIEPYIRPEKPLSFAIRFGIGPAFLTTVYDEETNPDNLFFSSHISFIALLNFSCNYRVSERVNLRLAGNFNHISNAGYSEPNLGINFPSVNAGFDYSFTKPNFIAWDKDPSVVMVDRKNRFDIVAGISAKPIDEGKYEKRYPVYGFTLNYSRAVGRIFALAGGVEYVNDLSLEARIRRLGLVDGDGEYIDHNRAGALAGIEWLFGKFIFYQQFGYYLYADFKEKGDFYQRYGLNFKISDHIFAGLNIKAEAQDADYMDARVGFYF